MLEYNLLVLSRNPCTEALRNSTSFLLQESNSELVFAFQAVQRVLHQIDLTLGHLAFTSKVRDPDADTAKYFNEPVAAPINE